MTWTAMVAEKMEIKGTNLREILRKNPGDLITD